MNYWQFKFRNEETSFQELATLKDGDIFFTEITEDHILKKIGLETIIFWDRIDKEKGILLVAKMIGYPYESDELSSAKAIPMKVIKKFIKPFILEKNGFKKLHDKLNTTKLKGRVQPRAQIDEETGDRLLNKILPNLREPDLNLINIDKQSLTSTIKLFLDNYTEYQEDGKNGYYYNIFMEANIARQEIRHSSFLANLFNKDGNHFHNNLFFKNFMNELKQYKVLSDCEAISNFNIENYHVVTEEYDDNDTKKGFMDIVINDRDYMIIIENKTGTKDHTGQLIRYKNYAQKLKDEASIKDYIVLYLTPKGEMPEDVDAQDDEKIISISYIDDIYKAMKNSIDDIKNETLIDIINQYYESINLYANNLPINWEYELNTINTITQDLDTFKNCESITQLVNYNIISQYDFSNEEIKIANWIAKLFIKSKARIERNFFVELHNIIKDDLQKQNFYYDAINSNILTELREKYLGLNTTIINDINTICNSRYIRQSGFPKKKTEEFYAELRKLTRSYIVYENRIDKSNVIYLNIQNDITGLHISTEYYQENNVVENVSYILEIGKDAIIFDSNNIYMLFNQDNMSKYIKDCKIKVLNALKQIEI